MPSDQERPCLIILQKPQRGETIQPWVSSQTLILSPERATQPSYIHLAVLQKFTYKLDMPTFCICLDKKIAIFTLTR